MSLQKPIDHFQLAFNDPPSTIIVIEETIHTVKEEHKTEINISIGMI